MAGIPWSNERAAETQVVWDGWKERVRNSGGDPHVRQLAVRWMLVTIFGDAEQFNEDVTFHAQVMTATALIDDIDRPPRRLTADEWVKSLPDDPERLRKLHNELAATKEAEK